MLRRSFLQGLGALFVAPAIVRASNLMPIKEYMPAVPAWCPDGWLPLDGREIKARYYPDLYAVFEKCKYPMKLVEHNQFLTIEGYQLPTPYPKTVYKKIISARNLYRPNGTVMPAGAYYDLAVKEEV
jgi:hypothetical protein